MAEAMSMLRSRVGVAVMRNRLYAFGGYNGTERLSTVEVFNPLERVWSKVSPMHCKRRSVQDETLYATGLCQPFFLKLTLASVTVPLELLHLMICCMCVADMTA